MKALSIIGIIIFLISFAAFYFPGQSNSTKLYYICKKEIPWFSAVFLNPPHRKEDCEKYE